MDSELRMDRRDLLQRALVLVGATLAAGAGIAPGSALSRPLPSDHLPLLTAFADTLIPGDDTPGAVAAGIPTVVAQMYADWASDETRDALSGALTRLDQAAQRTQGRGFADLPPELRTAFLAEHDRASLVAVPLPPGAPRGNPFAPVISVVDNGYARLKELVAVLFYASEAALTSELDYEHIPGGWTASVPVTPQTRPAYTFGAF